MKRTSPPIFYMSEDRSEGRFLYTAAVDCEALEDRPMKKVSNLQRANYNFSV